MNKLNKMSFYEALEWFSNSNEMRVHDKTNYNLQSIRNLTEIRNKLRELINDLSNTINPKKLEQIEEITSSIDFVIEELKSIDHLVKYDTGSFKREMKFVDELSDALRSMGYATRAFEGVEEIFGVTLDNNIYFPSLDSDDKHYLAVSRDIFAEAKSKYLSNNSFSVKEFLSNKILQRVNANDVNLKSRNSFSDLFDTEENESNDYLDSIFSNTEISDVE